MLDTKVRFLFLLEAITRIAQILGYHEIHARLGKCRDDLRTLVSVPTSGEYAVDRHNSEMRRDRPIEASLHQLNHLLQRLPFEPSSDQSTARQKQDREAMASMLRHAVRGDFTEPLSQVHVVTGGWGTEHVVGVFSQLDTAEDYARQISQIDGNPNHGKVETFKIDQRLGMEAKECFTVHIELSTGRISKPAKWKKRMLLNADADQVTHQVRDFANVIEVTSPVSEAHANREALRLRREWIEQQAASYQDQPRLED